MATGQNSDPLRLLVVEDNEDDFRYVQYLLRVNTINRYQVDWAPSYEEGLAAVRSKTYDAALFDYQLGGRTGVDLLRELIGAGSDMPVILLTGSDDLRVDQEAASSGAADYVCKQNLDTVHLERSIRYALRQAEMVRALRESQSQLQLFMRNVPCAICIQNEAGEYLFRNELFQRHFDGAALAEASASMPDGTSWQFDVADHHWLIDTFPMVDAAGRKLRGLAAVDITGRIRAEEQLRHTTSLLNGILTTLPVIASRVDEKGLITESRGHGLEAIGLKDGDQVGQSIFDLHPQETDEIQKALGGESVNFRWQADGRNRTHYFDNFFHFDRAQGAGAIGFSVNVTARVEAEAHSRRQSQLLTSVTRNLPIIVGRLDNSGCVVEAEGEGLAARKLSIAALMGRKFAEIYPQTREAISRALAGGSAHFNLSGRGESEEWQAEFFVFGDKSEQGGATFLGRDVTQQRTLEKRLLSISDSEQRRLGADLHDGLGQHLTGVACLATALRDRLNADKSPQAGMASEIASLVNSGIELTRALARGLCPVQVEQNGLPAALEDLAYQVQRLQGVQCHFDAIGPTRLIEPNIALHLYRITQEAVNNAVRHGAAQQIDITLDTERRPHQLIIEDNGCGFDPGALREGGGVGLGLMNYRATIIGGMFKINPQPRGGIRVECTFTNNSSSDENPN
ncbi:response regulator [Horticoccus luteus]|uniref:histidine kinase n=1 Tax=Horticoccus luteus TaxID=2862869 RepID=A0A8F9TVG1_9BACT|nr:response regulator [Horticoccus luteus]QYM79033.1 response regulator [Horticoccus luteus]